MARFVPRESLHVIPNPVRPPSPATPPRDNSHAERIVVGMGTLSPLKQFDLLLAAFAKLSAAHPQWSLMLIGEGPERGSLEALAARLGMAAKVRLVGLSSEPERLLQRADLFVLTSRYEGFPNALLEAMSYGVPVVSFDCPSGPRSIIRDGIDGLLVPDQDLDALTAAMDRLMADPEERRALGLRAREVTERFGVERIMAMWDDLIAECIRKNRARPRPRRLSAS
jgi:glycosyltransferase involved in cell wall biosynthesis